MTILHIDSSILGGYSVSRSLSADIVARLKALEPDASVIYRDLVVDAALHLSDRHLSVFQGAAVTDPLLGADPWRWQRLYRRSLRGRYNRHWRADV